MIYHIEVDGFRSLSHFALTVRPGLNILVGPNGSGKTNIIEFFQFLSYIMSYDLTRAISMSGGAGSVFTRTEQRLFKPRASATTHGRTDSPSRRDEKAHQYLDYMYSFEVAGSEALDQVYFKRQRFCAVFSASSSRQPQIQPEPRWDIDVRQEFDEDSPPRLEIVALNEKGLSESLRMYAMRRPGEKELSVRADFSRILAERSATDFSIIDPLSFLIFEARGVMDDTIGGEILNIVPSRVKQPEDSATPYGIRSDGSGLAATLYALDRGYRWHSPHGFAARTRRSRVVAGGRRLYPQIREYLQLVNTTIQSMSVYNDPYGNQIKINFAIQGEKGDITLPISAMSDGTVKWLALITAVLTYRSIFAIEEPENFLHPLMQKEIVKIMREDTVRRGGQAFVIMTTHSETLLNAAEPEEVVVVSMEYGSTKVSRPSDPHQLRNEIRESGFGLGFYYIIGALDHA